MYTVRHYSDRLTSEKKKADTVKLLLALSVAGDEVFLPLGVSLPPFFFGGTYKAKQVKAKVMETA